MFQDFRKNVGWFALGWRAGEGLGGPWRNWLPEQGCRTSVKTTPRQTLGVVGQHWEKVELAKGWTLNHNHIEPIVGTVGPSWIRHRTMKFKEHSSRWSSCEEVEVDLSMGGGRTSWPTSQAEPLGAPHHGVAAATCHSANPLGGEVTPISWPLMAKVGEGDMFFVYRCGSKMIRVAPPYPCHPPLSHVGCFLAASWSQPGITIFFPHLPGEGC